MAKSERARSAKSGAKSSAPIGGRYYTRHRSAVSGQFIRSLSNDGVSRDTIRAIERDNTKRTSGSHRAADAKP